MVAFAGHATIPPAWTGASPGPELAERVGEGASRAWVQAAAAAATTRTTAIRRMSFLRTPLGPTAFPSTAFPSTAYPAAHGPRPAPDTPVPRDRGALPPAAGAVLRPDLRRRLPGSVPERHADRVHRDQADEAGGN